MFGAAGHGCVGNSPITAGYPAFPPVIDRLGGRQQHVAAKLRGYRKTEALIDPYTAEQLEEYLSTVASIRASRRIS